LGGKGVERRKKWGGGRRSGKPLRQKCHQAKRHRGVEYMPGKRQRGALKKAKSGF